MFRIYCIALVAIVSLLADDSVLRSGLKKMELATPIRVQLERSLPNELKWNIFSPHGFVLISADKKHAKLVKYFRLTITSSNGSLVINGTDQKTEHLYIVPYNGFLSYQNNMYDGFFVITRFEDQIALVNHLAMEDYVIGVLPYELGIKPTENKIKWPVEAQKAQAVAIRTYALRKRKKRELQQLNNYNKPHDVKNTVIDQVYKGKSNNLELNAVAATTKGIILTYEKKPINAMFFSCCGGVIPAKITVLVNVSKVPFLDRKVACNYCKESRYYRWKCFYNYNELHELLKHEIPHGKKIDALTIAATDGAGLVKELKFKSDNKWISVSGKTFRSLIPKIKSQCFVIKNAGRHLCFDGKGHGHFIGMCQWGAYGMAHAGRNYKEILQFYYPNAQFASIEA